MWKKLRNHQLLGAKFRRQHPIGRYIVDFYCREYCLAGEIDGAIHDRPEQQEYDELRRKELEAAEVNLMVFTNEELFADPQAVLNRISNFLLHSKNAG